MGYVSHNQMVWFDDLPLKKTKNDQKWYEIHYKIMVYLL
jgi:hypothetical protein